MGHNLGGTMGSAHFRPCPHCNAALSYLEGVAGSSMTPKCPRCHEVVDVPRATFLMADHSRPSSRAAEKPR
jgi:phage FluMu protein Com